MKLNITTIEFNIVALENINLPEHPGSTFRGAFGQALRELSCNFANMKCEKCNLNSKCPYSLFFNPFLTEKDKLKTSGRFHNKLRPFIIEPAISGKTEYLQGENIKFTINVFGEMKQFIPYIIESWRNLQGKGIGANRGKFLLGNIWIINDILGKSIKIYDYKDELVVNKELSISVDDINKQVNLYKEDKVTFIFKSPTLLKYKGQYIKKSLEFNILMRNLFRRLSTLAAFYGEEMDIYFKDYLDKATEIVIVNENLEWKQWFRYSNKQQQKIDMQGFTGMITYQGDIKQFLPYLIIAQYIHIGKNTVFGQGNFQVLS